MTWRERSIDGLSFRWQPTDAGLRVELRSPTKGWVTVGFNDRPTLAGTRLFMAKVVNGIVTVEEHLADPPNHAPVADQTSIQDVRGSEEGGTFVAFTIQAAELGPHVTLAWSHDDDFQHHSARRSMVTLDK